MCFLLSIKLLCDCAGLVVVVVRSGCCYRRIPRFVVAVGFAPSVIVSSATDLPRPPSPRLLPTIGASGEPWTTTTTARPRRASRLRHDVFFLLIVPARLCRLLCCPPPPKMSFPKLAEDDLQEIVRVPPRFHVGVVVILCRDAASVIALPILPPNEQRANVDRRHRRCRSCRTPAPPRRSAVVATIKLRRILSARRRRESSRRRRG